MMTLERYETAAAFDESCRKHLLLEEAKNNMFLGGIDAAMSVYSGKRYLFGEIKTEGHTALVFLCGAEGHMFLYSPTGGTDQAAYDFLAGALCAAGVNVNSVKAEPLCADSFARAYARQTGRTSRISMRMHILLLKELKPIKVLGLEVRKMTLEDDYAFTPEQIQFIREGVFGQEGLYFLMKDSIPVSQAAIRRKVSIGGVYTPGEYRRNGYSSTLVFQLAKRILEDGNPYCVVHTDADHLISNRMYINMGFEHIADMKDIVFD